MIYLLLYEDDMLIDCEDRKSIEDLKTRLRNMFEMKNLSPVRKILGMEFRRDIRKRSLF